MSSESATETESRVPDEISKYGVEIGYWLFFLPLLALYPIYYVVVSLDEDREIEDEMELSPFHDVIFFSSGDSLLLPVISTLVGVGVLFNPVIVPMIVRRAIAVPRLSSIALGPTGMTLTGVLTGVSVTFAIRNRLERDLLKRMVYSVGNGVSLGVVFCALHVWLYTYPITPTYLFRPFLIPLVATVYGGAVANGYIIKEQEVEKFQKMKGEKSDTHDHTETLSFKGTEIGDSKGQKLIENFTEAKWVVPDELPSVATVENTRRLKPLRDIVRALWVEESHYKKTVPETRFSTEKGKLRSDYDRRQRVAPDGFDSKTYEFYKPRSKDVYSCSECSGRGEIDCSKCGRSGRVECGSCSGSGQTKCRKCRGNGKITVDETCGVCRGSGETSNGWECDDCSGYGSVERTKNCPNCRRGKVNCSSCGGGGKKTCSSCGGRGTHDCGQCDACGQLVDFEYVERHYSPDKDVSYRTKSVPESLLTDASGTRKSIETDDDPSQSDLYRRQDETREIPVVVTTYTYHGDKWELFDVEGSTKARDFPRDYQRQFRVALGTLAVSVVSYIYLVHLSPLLS